MDPYHIAVLSIGALKVDVPRADIAFHHAENAKDALLAIRMFKIDIAVAALGDDKVDVCSLMHRVSQLPHKCHWLCFSSKPSREDEIVARSLGAFVIANVAPDAKFILKCVVPHPASIVAEQSASHQAMKSALPRDLFIRRQAAIFRN